MADRAILPEALASEIEAMLQAYTKEVSEGVTPIVDEVAKAAAADLRQRSPRKTGAYASGWRIKKLNAAEGAVRVIYNAKKPGLAHLLEKGHAKRGGGRVAGIPHIKPVADEYGAQLTQRLGALVIRGGR